MPVKERDKVWFRSCLPDIKTPQPGRNLSMKQDFNDPNNHVPPVSEDDDWDDGGKSAESSHRALPPKRGRSEAPVIREGNTPRISTRGDNQDEKAIEGKKGKTIKKAQKKGKKRAVPKDVSKGQQATIPSKRSPKDKSKKPVAAPKGSSSAKAKATLKVEKQAANTETEERIVLPSQDVTRFRVKEIGTGETAAFTKPDPAKMSSDSLRGRSKMAGGGRRWAKDAEGAAWGSKGGVGNFKWIIYSGLGAMALVVLFVMLSVSREGGDKLRRDQSYFSKLEVEEDDYVVEGSVAEFDKVAKSRDRAFEIYRQYARADDIDGLQGLLHDEATVLPLIRENWEPLNYPDNWSLDDSTQWTAIDHEDIRYGVLEGQSPDFGQFSAIFRINGEDLVLDWKATVGYGTSSYDVLFTGEGDGSEIRGFLSQAQFYSFSYPESDWVSYRLLSPSRGKSIWVYAARESEIAKRLRDEFSASQITGQKADVAEVTLSIDPGVEESMPSQWQIKELLRMSWLEE